MVLKLSHTSKLIWEIRLNKFCVCVPPRARARVCVCVYNSYKTYKLHIMTAGNIIWPSFAFPFVCHLYFSVGKICNLHKGRVGDRKTMRAMPDSKSAGYPLFLTRLPFPKYLFFQNLFFIF